MLPGKLLTDNMAERLLSITKKFGLNYGESYEELYTFVATLTPEQQDDITLTLIRGNRGCSTCRFNKDPYPWPDAVNKLTINCNVFGKITNKKCCDAHKPRRKP